uniref:Uncharacterized protein n=1 Tax=Setaria italica TaxID=4555 RepID=K4A4B3_SETIT
MVTVETIGPGKPIKIEEVTIPFIDLRQRPRARGKSAVSAVVRGLALAGDLLVAASPADVTFGETERKESSVAAISIKA